MRWYILIPYVLLILVKTATKSTMYMDDNSWYTPNIYIYIYPQGSLVEITNQRFSLKYQMFRQLAAAFISGSGLQSVHVLTSGISK